MPEILSIIDFKKEAKKVPTNLLSYSYNKNTTLSANTKLIIVGTLTPPDTAYFYCSFFNRIYGYIDEALKQLGRNGKQSLKELKRGLSKVQTKRIKIDLLAAAEIKDRVNSIRQILHKNGIAFLDVMDKAIRKKQTCYDDDILFFTLAYDDFKKVDPNTVIIANSKLAFDCCLALNIKPHYLSQRFDKKTKWIKEIINAIK